MTTFPVLLELNRKVSRMKLVLLLCALGVGVSTTACRRAVPVEPSYGGGYVPMKAGAVSYGDQIIYDASANVAFKRGD